MPRNDQAMQSQHDQPPHGPGFVSDVLYAMSELDLALLLMIARLGRVQNHHLRRILEESIAERTIRRRMKRLRDHGFVASAQWSMTHRSTTQGVPPPYRGLLHVLTPRGENVVDDRFEHHDFKFEKLISQGAGSIIHQAEHQVEYVDLVVGLIEIVRELPGMIGVSSATEILLGPERSPRCDGYFVCRRWNDSREGTLADPHQPYSPWLTLPKKPTKQTDLAYAIEIDRGTEAPTVIAKKARDYMTVFRSGWWKGKYPWPIPVWVVPSESRRAVIVREWLREWPDSPLFIATKPDLDRAGVHALIWHMHYNGRMEQRQLLPEDWSRPILQYPDHPGQKAGHP